MIVLETGDTALVIMETLLDVPRAVAEAEEIRREATYVFRRSGNDRWLCAIDNSYGTRLLDS